MGSYLLYLACIDYLSILEARNISNNTTEVTLAAMEVITISSSEDDPDDPSVWIPDQSDAEVSESSEDEGVNDLDEGETEKGDPDDVPGLKDESEEENEAPPGLEADESSTIGNEGTLEQIQYQLRDLVKIMEQLGNLRKYQTASSA